MRKFTLLFVTAIFANLAEAQPAVSGLLERTIDANLDAVDAGNDYSSAPEDILNDSIERLLLEPTVRSVAERARFRRADLQVGASSASGGGTSAVSNPLLPGAIGLALETGAITRSVSGTTTTLKLNPAGLFCLSSENRDAVALRERGCGSYDAARKFALSVSFDSSRGDAPATGLQPIGDQFSEASARIEILDRRSAKSTAFQRRVRGNWNMAARNAGVIVRDYQRDLDSLVGASERMAFEERVNDILATYEKNGGRTQAKRLLLEAAEDLISMLRANGAIRGKLAYALPTFDTFVRAERALWDQLSYDWVVSAEYSYRRPDISVEGIEGFVMMGERPPSLHTARLIASKGISKANVDFTLNASSSWFGEARPGMQGLWRDAQVSGDAKFILKEIPDYGSPVFSIAALWMRLRQRPLGINISAFNDAEINEPGNIGILQAKLELPTTNAALKIPISFTYASRTELVKESDVRGQIGITLNLDSFFAKGPSNQ